MPGTGSAMFYFYTNELKFTPEFLGSLKFVYAVGTIVGLFIYNKFYKQLEFKKIFSITLMLSVAMGYTHLILVTRLNI